MEAPGEVQSAVQGGQARLTIDRPRAHNALSPSAEPTTEPFPT